jgi:hypothetical protein
MWDQFYFFVAANVYEARNKLLGLEEPKVVADIPPTYHIPENPPVGTLHNGEAYKPYFK